MPATCGTDGATMWSCIRIFCRPTSSGFSAGLGLSSSSSTSDDDGGVSTLSPNEEPRVENDPLWYKDAIIYEVHVRAFQDSNADGIGDFRGLTDRLDYLRDLGVTAIWLLPFYPSPLKDDGYDIADYYSINPLYGTLKDFKVFLKEAHAHGLRVITELVV